MDGKQNVILAQNRFSIEIPRTGLSSNSPGGRTVEVTENQTLRVAQVFPDGRYCVLNRLYFAPSLICHFP
jgi:hypothetical protein